MNYYLLNTMPLEDEGYCFLEQPPVGIEMTDYKLAQGLPMAAEYPPDVRMYMDDAHPGVKLPDLVGNTRGLLIVSQRLKDAIAGVVTAPTEYLPVSIYNHKKRLASAGYFVVNPLGALDCLHLQRSDIKWKGADIVTIRKFVLDSAKLGAAPDLFRIREQLYQYVLSAKLGRALAPLQPTNLYVDEIEQA
jgi:hypothetical protein